jgi:hypothetical protein
MGDDPLSTKEGILSYFKSENLEKEARSCLVFSIALQCCPIFRINMESYQSYCLFIEQYFLLGFCSGICLPRVATGWPLPDFKAQTWRRWHIRSKACFE